MSPESPALLAVSPIVKRIGRGPASKPDGATLGLWTRIGFYALHLDAEGVRALRLELAKCDTPVSAVPTSPEQLQRRG